MPTREAMERNRDLAAREWQDKVARVSSHPPVLTIETTSICNLRCVMCPQAIDGVDRPRHLPVATLDKLVPYIQNAWKVQLHGIGEPMASQSFWNALDHIPEGCEATINTNFTLLSEKKFEKLVMSDLLWINLSLDAARPDTYRKIRGFDLERVLRNVRRFNELKKERGRTTPHLHMNMTLMRENIEEVVEFVELAHMLEARGVLFWHLNRWPDAEMARYGTRKGDWTFDYEAQGLWNHKALSNAMLRKAVRRGEELGIAVDLENIGKETIYEDAGQEAAA